MRRSRTAARLLDAALNRLAKQLGLASFEATFIADHIATLYGSIESGIRLSRDSRQAAGQQVSREIPTIVHLGVNTVAYDLERSETYAFGLGGHQASNEEQLNELLRVLNDVFLSLFVRAFESFEAYYREALAIVGRHDFALWKYGRISARTGVSRRPRDLGAARNAIARKRNGLGADEILRWLRIVCPLFRAEESRGAIGVDYSVMFRLIPFFRHLCVHSAGKSAGSEFWSSVARITGRSIRIHTSRDPWRRRVEGLVREEGGEIGIWLVDDASIRAGRTFATGRVPFLMSAIASEAALGYAKLIRHFGSTPIWKRRRTRK